MTAEDCLIGIDCGLTVTKAIVFDTGGRELGIGRRETAQIKPGPRRVERDMLGLWADVCGALREALAGIDAGRVRAVCVTGHGDGVYLLDGADRPLGTAILSLDTRAAGIIAGWREAGVLAAALEQAGQIPYAAAPAPLLAWLKANEPERYAGIGRVLSCKDWIRFKLTGGAATDFTEASTSFTDYRTQAYGADLPALYGVPEMAARLPEVGMPADIGGVVTAAAAAETGLAIGTPVAMGLHDVTATAVGMGVAAPGSFAVVAGSFSINEVFSNTPVPSASWLCRNGIAAGQWLNMAISPAASSNMDWFVKTLCQDAVAAGKEAGGPFAMLDGEIAAAFADPSDLQFHPFIYGSPVSDDASGGFFGIQAWHHRGHLLRAVMEGIVFNHRYHLDGLRTRFAGEAVRLSGGISRSPLARQLFADALGLRVETVAAEETGALGAAIIGGVAVGLFADAASAAAHLVRVTHTYEPDRARRDRLADAYERYLGLIDALKPHWAGLRGAAGTQAAAKAD
ncbi:MAG: carbohydrate kinase [Rhodospirillaceae bacterium]|nr:carbohydrate kinase [Rhodospirillaceae bacterium]